MILNYMTLDLFHPGLVLILGAWVLPFLIGRVQQAARLLLPATALAICLQMGHGTYGDESFLFGRVDQLSLVFSYVFSIITLIGMVYSLHVDDDAQHVTALTYAGGALGVTFAGDLLSLYVF